MKVVGLISGTSADGIDAALLEVVPSDTPSERPGCVLLAYRESALGGSDRAAILRAAAGDARTPDIARLRRDLGGLFADAAVELLAGAGVPPSEVEVVGCHGQTVWHEPPDANGPGTSLQLVDAAVLASRTGIPVVSDFRSADLAAGGQGAPLVPWADQVFYAHPTERRAVQNLGGMGNVTWLPRGDSDEEPLAFDTGPGNALLDLAAERATGGELTCDLDGGLAVRGVVDGELLERLLADPFFASEPPRSTGRERFGPVLLDRILAERPLPRGRPDAWCDLLATLTALTVESVSRAYRAWVLPRGVDRVILTGGGVRNPVLALGIREALAPLPVEHDPADLRIPGAAREAATFGLLAWAFVSGIPGNVPSCTGASGPRVLGSWTPAPGRRVGGASAR